MSQGYLILLFIASAILLILGIKWLVPFIFGKSITTINLSERSKTIEFKKPGIYSVTVVGGGYFPKEIGNFSILNNRTRTEINVRYLSFGPRLFVKSEIGVEVALFEIDSQGNYDFKVINIDLLRKYNYKLLIRPSQKVLKSIFGIVFIFLGVKLITMTL